MRYAKAVYSPAIGADSKRRKETMNNPFGRKKTPPLRRRNRVKNYIERQSSLFLTVYPESWRSWFMWFFLA